MLKHSGQRHFPLLLKLKEKNPDFIITY